MPLYRTEYNLHGPKSRKYDPVNGDVWAKDQEHRNILLVARGLGEHHLSVTTQRHYLNSDVHPRTPFTHAGGYIPAKDFPTVAQQLRDPKTRVGHKFHALSYLCMLGYACGLLTGVDILWDFGLLHNLAHVYHLSSGGDFESSARMQDIIKAVELIEPLIPGHLQIWEDGRLP